MATHSHAIVQARASRALRHWPTAALERAQAGVVRTWQDWCERWRLDGSVTAAFNAVDAAPTPGGHWVRVPGLAAWLAADAGPAADALEAVLFDRAPAGGAIGRDVAAAALADLLEALGGLCVGSASADADAQGLPPAADARRWSGAVVVDLALRHDAQALRWRLHCGQAVAAVVCGGVPVVASSSGRRALVGVTQAIAARPVRLRVCLQPAEFTLGTLRSLHVGDVLPLSHRLDAPLQVSAPGAPAAHAVVCSAYLGRRDQSRAVELVASPSESH